VIAQPRNARSTRTRAAILDAAWRLLEQGGPEAATMTAVAQAAGVTRKGLYLHFASRAELLSALRGHVDEVLNLEVSLQPIRQAPNAAVSLDEWVRHLVEYHSRIRVLVDAVDRARATDADAAALWEEATALWLSGCREMADWLEREGRLAPGLAAAEAADALLGMMLSFNRLWEALVVERGWAPERFRQFLARMHHATLTREPV
jgi:AcrR family transcriptional regulator